MIRICPLICLLAAGCSSVTQLNSDRHWAQLLTLPNESERSYAADVNHSPAGSERVPLRVEKVWRQSELQGIAAYDNDDEVEVAPSNAETDSIPTQSDDAEAIPIELAADPVVESFDVERTLVALVPLAEPPSESKTENTLPAIHAESVELTDLPVETVAENVENPAAAQIESTAAPGSNEELAAKPATRSHYVGLAKDRPADIADRNNRDDVAVTIDRLQGLMQQIYQTQRLRLQNARLCRQVKGLGEVVDFQQREFDAGASVLVYCEVANFATDSEESASQTLHRSRLAGSLVIMNDDSELVYETDYSPVDFLCPEKQPASFIVMPAKIPDAKPGKYRLYLFVSDELGNKPVAAAPPIEFQVRSDQVRNGTRL